MSFLLSGLPISKEFIFPHESQKNIHNYNMLLIVIYGHDFHSAWAYGHQPGVGRAPPGGRHVRPRLLHVRRRPRLFAKVKGLTVSIARVPCIILRPAGTEPSCLTCPVAPAVYSPGN